MAIRDQGVADFVSHLSIVAQSLAPWVLGTDYSIADVYLYMLAVLVSRRAREALYARLPALGRHAKGALAKAALAKVEADHAA